MPAADDSSPSSGPDTDDRDAVLGPPPPVPLRQAVGRLGLLVLSAGLLVLGSWALQPEVAPDTDGVWGVLFGDRWVVGAVRFVAAAAASFLLASILVLTIRGRWIERAGGVDAGPQVQRVWDQGDKLEERLRRAEESKAELLQLLDEETTPTPSLTPLSSPAPSPAPPPTPADGSADGPGTARPT